MNDTVIDTGAAAAAETPAAPGGDSAASETNEFEGLFSFDEGLDAPSSSESQGSQQQSEEGAPGQKPAEQPAAEGQQQPEAPAAQPQQPVTGDQTQQPAKPVEGQQPAASAPQSGQAQDGEGSQQQQPQYTKEQLTEMRTNFINDQAKELVPMMTEDFLTELRDSPQTAFPKMAAEVIARTHDMLVPMMAQMIQQAVPNLVATTVHQNQTAADGTKRFFDAFPELNTKELHAVVQRVGTTYRQANPKATAEQFMKDVGTSAWVVAGLDIAVLQQRLAGMNGQQPAQQPTVTVQPQAPFRPAAPGGGSQASHQQQQPQGNEFEVLTEEAIASG